MKPLALFALSFSLLASAQPDDPLAKGRSSFERQLEAIDAEAVEADQKTLGFAATALARLQQGLSERGNTAAASATEAEAKRLASSGTLAAADLVAEPVELRAFQSKVQARLRLIKEESAKRKAALQSRYIKSLGTYHGEVAQAGNLALAESLKAEATRVQALQFVSSDGAGGGPSTAFAGGQAIASGALPDPDGKPADMSTPVQVFILLGQSNMLGFGKIRGGDGSLEHATKEKDLYPYLVDDIGNWTVRQDVRNVRVMGSGAGGMKKFNNEWMTIGNGNIGPEIGIGHHLGHASEAPVLVLKSCIGNRALGWDLLPPGSKQFEVSENGKTMVYAGYKDSPDKWEKGTEPKAIGWYAGVQYDGDIARAKDVLSDLGTYYPGATEYEVAGFFWWQGDRDSRSGVYSDRYEQNLVHLIKQLRSDFDAPGAKFVCASLGQTKQGAGDGGGKILDAMLAVDGSSGTYPEFKGNVAAVYSHPLSKGGSSGGHYSGNAETYMNVGEAMGEAMVKLLRGR